MFIATYIALQNTAYTAVWSDTDKSSYFKWYRFIATNSKVMHPESGCVPWSENLTSTSLYLSILVWTRDTATKGNRKSSYALKL